VVILGIKWNLIRFLIMRDCWMEAPGARPTFGDLVEDIGRILFIASGTVIYVLSFHLIL